MGLRPPCSALVAGLLTPAGIPTFPYPSLYFGDFNCQHINWGYSKTSPDGESPDSWATANKLGLLYDPNEVASFSSRRWNVGTNPDLAFASVGRTCCREVPAVTTLAFHHNATEIQSFSPLRSGEPLKLSQGWLEALLPSYRWFSWETATSGHNKH